MRLKIFSEINRGNHDLVINLHSIVASIKEYIDLLINNTSTTDNSINKIVKWKLRKGINNLGKLLWNRNCREILFFGDFFRLFDEDLVFKLIDEGLCFQRDLNDEDELVQFTYDLVGGYQIAKSVFFSDCNTERIISLLKSNNTKEKLFSKVEIKRHPLHEDIIKSISYLLPIIIRKQIFEILNEEEILIANLENLELLAFNDIETKKLISFIDDLKLSEEAIKQLLNRLYDDIMKRNNYNTLHIGANVLKRLNQINLDKYWHELLRKDSYKIKAHIESVIRNLDDYSDCINNVLLFTLMATGSADRRLRSEATKSLMYIGLKHPNELLALARTFMCLDDFFVLESLICSIAGVVLRLKNEMYSKSIVFFFQEEFLIKNKTNHVAILDCVKTVFDFTVSKFNQVCDYNLLSRNRNENWPCDKVKVDDIEKTGLWHYEMMDYDFIKFQITELSNEKYDSVSHYTKSQIIAMISTRIKLNGYSDKLYNAIEERIKEDNKYSREGVSERVKDYSKKYLDIAYKELAGFLMIKGEIKPEYINTYRFSYIQFDPTFPKYPSKTQLINDCYLPSYCEDIQDWINKDNLDLLNSIYVTKPTFEETEMVLLSASISQNNEINNTRIQIYISSYIFNKDNRSSVFETFDSHHINNTNELYNGFAGEIPWKEQINNDDMNSDYLPEEYFSSVEDYCWTSWTSDRYENPSFEFLNPRIANDMGVCFDVETLSFVDNGGKQITRYYKTDNSEFLFIDRKIFEDYFAAHNSDLIWNKYISKYGDFGMHNETKLSPSYKDSKDIKFFSEVIDSFD